MNKKKEEKSLLGSARVCCFLLIDEMMSKDKNVKILSAPAKTIPESPRGKIMWVKENLGSVELVICSAKEKQDYAKKNTILIDDSKENIDQWNTRGGLGILHKSAMGTIKKLKGLGI